MKKSIIPDELEAVNATCVFVRKTVVFSALLLVMLSARADQYWRGTDANPVWDTTTANWASSESGTTFSVYENKYEQTRLHFDQQGASDINVCSDGVFAYVINVVGGNHSLRGGSVSAQVLDPKGGQLEIFNAVDLATSNDSYGFRARAGGSTISIGAGGALTAQINPWTDSTLDTRLAVVTNGMLKAVFLQPKIRDNSFTMYFDGGMLMHMEQVDRTFGQSRFVLGAGGLHFKDYPGFQSGATQFMPGPILTDGALATDGGVWVDDIKGYMLLPSSTACTYRGGVHINTSTGYLAVRSDGNLGAVPSVPENNIYFLKNNASLVAHGQNGHIAIHPNRNIFIANGVKARLLTYYGKPFSMLVHGTISCENVQNGVLETSSYVSFNDDGAIVLCPSDNSTNRIGRLLVKTPTVIGSGTTLLESSLNPGVDDSAILHVSDTGDGNVHGHLMVTGGVLRTTASNNHICQNGRLTISGGTVDFSGLTGSYELLHAHRRPAVTTIKDGGKLAVNTIRMSGDNADFYSDAANSVVNVETGGVLCVKNKVYIHDSNGFGKKGALNFNGGILEWANPNDGWDLEGSPAETTRAQLSLTVFEGGMIVTNDNAFGTGIPICSGTEKDGGLTKWGAGTFSLKGACTFVGPLTVMQGDIKLIYSDILNKDITMRVNAGASFLMNGKSQTFARIEGSGLICSASSGAKLTVTKAIAPGMGQDRLGTLKITDTACYIADGVVLEIDADGNGNCDCFEYPEKIDLSGMNLMVNDLTKLARDKTHTIAKLSGGIKDGVLFRTTNLPESWKLSWKSSACELQLVPVKGTAIVLR